MPAFADQAQPGLPAWPGPALLLLSAILLHPLSEPGGWLNHGANRPGLIAAPDG
ncbi:hypothetical protein ABEH33_16240 [Pantoea agglomerans]|uniref:hypothetical protein n=1 Tax=Enterobacter agglomerans TaxID=549 RepID=UPI002A6F3606|nr:hypothetical protein [Pantoea brenneri]